MDINPARVAYAPRPHVHTRALRQCSVRLRDAEGVDGSTPIQTQGGPLARIHPGLCYRIPSGFLDSYRRYPFQRGGIQNTEASPQSCNRSESCGGLTMLVPDFELLSFIGRGGYGDVWLARDREGRHWAVKIVYRSSFDDARPYDREYKGILRFFPISAKSESQLRVMHVGRRDEDGCFYYIMELADDASGAEVIRPDTYTPHTLRSELLQRRRIPASEVCALGWSLTNALENLHANGLVHRDIKPGNIIFVGGRPKLADVGLVTDADLTRTFAGTEGYIPPEGPGTYRADIYSLGMTLYEACTGCDRREFPALPENVAELPDHGDLLRLIRVVNRACQPDRRRRYQTTAEIRKDLERLLGGGSVSEGPLRGKTIVSVTAGGLGIVAAIGLWTSRVPNNEKVPSGSTNPLVAMVPVGGTTNEPGEPPRRVSSENPSPTSWQPTVTQNRGTNTERRRDNDSPEAPILRPRGVQVRPPAVTVINPKERIMKDAKERLDEATREWNQATAARVAAVDAVNRAKRRNVRLTAQKTAKEAEITEHRAAQMLSVRRIAYEAAQREFELFERSKLSP